MEKKNSNQHQDNKKPADKKRTGSQSGSENDHALGKKHDSGEDTNSRIPDRKKQIDDDPNETARKVPNMNQKS